MFTDLTKYTFLLMIGLAFMACMSSPFAWKTHIRSSSSSAFPSNSEACTLLFTHKEWILNPPSSIQFSNQMDSNQNTTSSRLNDRLPINGIWWWSHPTHRYGSVRWINSSLTHQWQGFLNQLSPLNIRRFYTESLPLMTQNPSRLKKWHQFLHTHGRESDLLLGDPTWACQPKKLFQIIKEILIPFQQKAHPTEGFDGIYLDLEPHTLTSDSSLCPFQWTSSSSLVKQDLLYGLLYTLMSLKAILDNELDHPLSLSVYLPFWFDQLDPHTQIWTSAEQRTLYYQCLADTVDAATIAGYCRSNPQELQRVIQWEANHFPSLVRLGLNLTHHHQHTSCPTWKNNAHLFKTVHKVRKELILSTRRLMPIDFEHLVYWIQSQSNQDL